jgi:hypothetical protein
LNETLYYVVGTVLAVCAVAVSFAGLRNPGFGASRGGFRAVLGFMTALVLVTAVGAVLNARAEQKHRRVEFKEFKEEHKKAE